MKRPRASARAADDFQLPGWDRLRHGGLLFDAARAAELAKFVPKEPLTGLVESRFRRLADALGESKDAAAASRFVTYTLDEVCGFARSGGWTRGNKVPAEEGRRALTGELAKPRSLWTGRNGARLPVFFDRGQRLGVGRGRREMSRVVEWLRNGGEHLALLTNGREWRLVFAGLDYEAWCEWTVESFFEEGGLAPQVETLRALLSPPPWIPETEGKDAPLLRAIRDTRKGQAAVSEELGERVREAVEILIRSHGEPLKQIAGETDPADIYRAACRVAMRMVVVLYAESRDLLPRDNALYDAAYGLTALRDRLQRHEAAGRPLSDRTAAWPRLLALFRLVFEGCSHSELPVTRYGGELFAPGAADSEEGVSRALSVFESACFDNETASDDQVNAMLRLLTRTRIRVRKGRTSAVVAAPVDFSDLSSEYIGVLYEGLLDYELKTAGKDDPVVFLPVGDRPALPLSRLEEMEDQALKALFEKLKKPSAAADEAEPEEATAEEAAKEDEPEAAGDAEETPDDGGSPADEGAEYRERARRWALRAVEAAKLVKKPRGRMTPERRLTHEREIASAAERLVARLVPPGEWYLVRWGGTRKGSGSFYTRPGLAIPTVQRTLRPLAFDPPKGEDGEPDRFAPGPKWSPKKPEDILRITVCDPACGSGTFPLAALRFLTDALYDSLRFHERIEPQGEASLVRLLGLSDGNSDRATEELIPAPPDADDFEPRLKAVLRRYVVERCIYAVDLDPLAVELCRLSLWIETMDRELPFGFLDHKIKCGNALIGAWFDQFRHYPVMAWKNRKGVDAGHTKRNEAFVKDFLTPDLTRFLGGRTLFEGVDLAAQASAAHDEAQATLDALHSLSVKDPAELARRYRTEFLGSSEWRSLKAAMDLWCACWFWPLDDMDDAPLPTSLNNPTPESVEIAGRVAARWRFFHWELEFPDVFRQGGSGFSAILGNPPWENPQPNPEEYFSSLDPSFRSYDQLTKQRWLADRFSGDRALERKYFDYQAGFKSLSHWVRNRGNPFGDPEPGSGFKTRTFPLGRRGREMHRRWRNAREKHAGYSGPPHAFRLQIGRLFTDRLFVEQSVSLLRLGGRCGLVIPSAIYSEAWYRPVREMLLTACRWEWLFSFENRKKIFPIDSRYKFNPIIVESGGVTGAVRTAFMRRDPDEWAEGAEHTAIPVTLAQIERFSPRTRAILEVRSPRDLSLLDDIYEQRASLGHLSDSEEVMYRLEFMMNRTAASKFPRRISWEEKGYRPDEYGRWLLGKWQPSRELWSDLASARPDSGSRTTELDEWLFDSTAGARRREREGRVVHGHFLKPGDVVREESIPTTSRKPYDGLLRLRVETGACGAILSREGEDWIREEDIEGIALPLYQGVMIRPFVPSAGGWEGGGGSRARWAQFEPADLFWDPQFLMATEDAASKDWAEGLDGKTGRLGLRDVTNSTNERTFLGAIIPDFPCGHSAPVLRMAPDEALPLLAVLNSFVFDWQTRQRGGGAHLIWSLLTEMALPGLWRRRGMASMAARLNIGYPPYSPFRVRTGSAAEGTALADGERRRLRCAIDAVVASLYGLGVEELAHVLRDTDLPVSVIRERRGTLDPCGFWRVDREKDPELRHPVLTLVAFHDLQDKIVAAGGDRDKGITAFLSQNEGEGWLIPEMVRLSDYSIGHDDRAKEHQPVAGRLGPRFYDWQLLQTPEEREQETHLHARNLLGAEEYGELLAERTTDDARMDEEKDEIGQRLTGALAARLENGYTRRLLGDEGVAALVAELLHRAIRRAQWPTFLQLLLSVGHIAPADGLRVLDRLLDRELISEPEHHRWRVLAQAPQDPSADLLAAEPKHEFQLRSQRDPRKLFDD